MWHKSNWFLWHSLWVNHWRLLQPSSTVRAHVRLLSETIILPVATLSSNLFSRWAVTRKTLLHMFYSYTLTLYLNVWSFTSYMSWEGLQHETSMSTTGFEPREPRILLFQETNTSLGPRSQGFLHRTFLSRASYLSDYLINFACLFLTKNEYGVTRATYLRTRVFISEVQKINDITVEHNNLHNPHIGLMIKILMVFLARRLTSQLIWIVSAWR